MEIIMIKECTKVRLKTGEIAHIVEVSKPDAAYVAEVIRKNGQFSVSVEPILQNEIASVFEEIERPLAAVS
jgi:hypothetical protein